MSRRRFVVQHADGSVLGPDGWSDYITTAIHFDREDHALAASHKHIASRVIPIDVHSVDYDGEPIHTQAEFMHTRHVVMAFLIFFLMTGLAACGGGSGSSTKTPPGSVVTITQQPQSVSVVSPAPATFAVGATATNGGTLHYAWTATAPGTTTANPVGSDNATYAVDPTAPNMSGTKIAVSVTADTDPVQSQPAVLTVTSSGTGDPTPPTLVQTQASDCTHTNSNECNSLSQTTITTAGNPLLIFVFVNYFGQYTTVQTPTLQDTNGSPIPTPGALDLSINGQGNGSICLPWNAGVGEMNGGLCALIYSEGPSTGTHVLSLAQAPSSFYNASIVAIEVKGLSHGVDATFYNYASCSPCNGPGGPVNFGSISTNLPNELIFVVGYSQDESPVAGAGFTKVWIGPSNQPSGDNSFLIETLAAPTAGAYPIEFYEQLGQGQDIANAFSIY